MTIAIACCGVVSYAGAGEAGVKGGPPTAQQIETADHWIIIGHRSDAAAIMAIRTNARSRAEQAWQAAERALQTSDGEVLSQVSGNKVVVDVQTDIRAAEADNTRAEHSWGIRPKARAFTLLALKLEGKAHTLLSQLPPSAGGAKPAQD